MRRAAGWWLLATTIAAQACTGPSGCTSDGLAALKSRGVSETEIEAVRKLVVASELPAECFVVMDAGETKSGCCQIEVANEHVVAIRVRLGAVGSLAPLSALPHLRRADFTANRLKPPFDLQGCKLRELNLYGNPVDGFAGLDNCGELKKLQLSGEDLKSLNGIETIGSLEEVGMESTNITDLRPLAKLPNLTSLSVNRSPVTNVAGLADHPKLRRLSLQGTRLRDVRGIHDLPALELLHVNDTPLGSFDGLVGVPKLERITANGSKVSDLKALTSLPGLRELEANRTQVAVLPDGLEGKLRVLRLEGTPLKSRAKSPDPKGPSESAPPATAHADD